MKLMEGLKPGLLLFQVLDADSAILRLHQEHPSVLNATAQPNERATKREI